MESSYKSLGKKILNLIKTMDAQTYTDNVRYVIFLLCKILFKIKTKALAQDGMEIFDEYAVYDLGIPDIESAISDISAEYFGKSIPNGFIPAELYESMLTSEEKKFMGKVYTPLNIIDGMLVQALSLKEIDPSSRILDPACGGGYFLIEAFRKLRSAGGKTPNAETDRAILENMIFGCDIDHFSIFLTKLGLKFNSLCCDAVLNIKEKDFLTEGACEGIHFDVIIGNPPYIGHKNNRGKYRKQLESSGLYSDVFYDKSDISYCFFKAVRNCLKDDGIVSFITSRYFMEAMYADRLRQYLKTNYKIISLIDYSGSRVFKEAMISPAIVTLQPNNELPCDNMIAYSQQQEQDSWSTLKLSQSSLDDSGWIMLSDSDRKLYDKIDSIATTPLSSLCTLRQGIITGCDKAFVVNDEQIDKHSIEHTLIRKWVKNSDISSDGISFRNMYLIYTNEISDEHLYPNTIKYLSKYKGHLIGRRECIKGYRKWYELQWGRFPEIFEKEKIMFPYKSFRNNFYLDKNKYYCSADVYMLDITSDAVSYNFLQNYLNSSIFEFYFKCVAKKVGIRLYEYYPNKLNSMKIFVPDRKTMKNISVISKISIENFLEKVFNISTEDKKIINKYLCSKGEGTK